MLSITKPKLDVRYASDGRIQESFQEGGVHFLQHPIIKDTRFEPGKRFRLKEVQVLRRHYGRDQVRPIGVVDLKLGLHKQNSFRSKRFPGTGSSQPRDGMLPHGWDHLGQDQVEKPRRKRFQREWPEFQGFGILPPPHVVMQSFFHLAFGPILDFAAWRVDLLVSPLHKLVAVVRLGPEIPNELIALCPLLLVYGELLLEAGFDDPVAELPASHPVHHVVERGKAQSRAAAPLKTHRTTKT